MITILVSIFTSLATTAAIYWVLHRADSTDTQKAIDATVAQAKTDVGTVVTDVEAKL